MIPSQAWIDGCRKNLQAGRDSQQLPTLTKPFWMKADDALNQTYVEAPRLLGEGEVVWGYLVQANQLLYDRGYVDMPAFVVFAKDRSLDATISDVEELRSVMFQQRSNPLDNDDARAFGAMLNREQERNFWLEVPKALSGGRKLHGSALMIVRSWLPKGALVNSPIPILIERHGGGQVIPLPMQFWPDDLVDAWQSLVPTEEEAPLHVPVGGLSWLTPVSLLGGVPLLAVAIERFGLRLGTIDLVPISWAAALVCIGLFLLVISLLRVNAGRKPERLLRNAYNDAPTVIETTDHWLVPMPYVGGIALLVGGILSGVLLAGGDK